MIIKKVEGFTLDEMKILRNEFIDVSTNDIAICMNPSGKMEWQLKPSVVIEEVLKRSIRWQ
jgi:hypothetical protein